MVRVYECINGHHIVPLMPSGFVKMLCKGFEHSLFVHNVVLELGFHVASSQLEKEETSIDLQVRLDQSLCKMHCFIVFSMAWSCFSCHY